MHNMVKDVLLWGMGEGYESILNQVLFEIEKKNINVVGIVCRKEDRYCALKDGFPICNKEEIGCIKFDFVIVTSYIFYDEIVKEAICEGIERRRIINGNVFRLPLFDFKKYVRLIENPVTILSNDCWGGMVYHRLSLPFSSPLINIRWPVSQFAKFVEDPVFFLFSDLKLVREGELKSEKYPIAELGEGENKVCFDMIHDISFFEAKKRWDRRRNRIHKDNFFVKMSFNSNASDEDKKALKKAYDKVSCKKILVSVSGDYAQNGGMSRFVWDMGRRKSVDTYSLNEYFLNHYHYDIDILNLLIYGKNYLRCSI